jgi:hypothetical protein
MSVVGVSCLSNLDVEPFAIETERTAIRCSQGEQPGGVERRVKGGRAIGALARETTNWGRVARARDSPGVLRPPARAARHLAPSAMITPPRALGHPDTRGSPW